MEHRLVTDSRCSAVFGNVTVYIDSFEVTGEKKFTYQPTVSTGIYFSELGRYPVLVKIKGRIPRSAESFPAVDFDSGMRGNTRYTFTIGTVKFRNSRLKKYSISEQTNSQFDVCELELYCESQLTQGEAT